MATRTITTNEHSCDLCGQPREEHELAHLYGPPERAPYSGPRLDICGECRVRPIADILSLLADRANTIHAGGAANNGHERTPEEVAEIRERLARLESEREQTA
jgi:hypothetical protein